MEVGRGDVTVSFKFQPINVQKLNHVHLDMKLLQLLNHSSCPTLLCLVYELFECCVRGER